jgi:hypothetical protein
MTIVRSPRRAQASAVAAATVVLPTPPFPDTKTIRGTGYHLSAVPAASGGRAAAIIQGLHGLVQTWPNHCPVLVGFGVSGVTVGW